MAVPLTKDVPPPPKTMCFWYLSCRGEVQSDILHFRDSLGSVDTFHHSTAIIYRKIKFLANESRYDFFIFHRTDEGKMDQF